MRDRVEVQRVFKKKLGTGPKEGLMLELRMNLPLNVRKESLEIIALVVAKLSKLLKGKDGPLGHCCTEQEYYEAAQKFLTSQKGIAWSKQNSQRILVVAKSTLTLVVESWFQPNDTEVVPIENLQGDDAGKATIVEPGYPVVDAVAQQNLPIVAAPLPHQVYHQPFIFQPPLPGIRQAPERNEEVVRHQRHYSDREVSLCTRCWSVHSTLTGGPFVPLDALNPAPTLKDAPEPQKIQGTVRNKGQGRRRFAKGILTLLQCATYIGFLMILVQSVEGCPCPF